MTEYQPYFAAYVAAGGSVDTKARNIAAYIVWINDQWHAFYDAHPAVRKYSSVAHEQFPAWLAQRVAR